MPLLLSWSNTLSISKHLNQKAVICQALLKPKIKRFPFSDENFDYGEDQECPLLKSYTININKIRFGGIF